MDEDYTSLIPPDDIQEDAFQPSQNSSADHYTHGRRMIRSSLFGSSIPLPGNVTSGLGFRPEVAQMLPIQPRATSHTASPGHDMLPPHVPKNLNSIEEHQGSISPARENQGENLEGKAKVMNSKRGGTQAGGTVDSNPTATDTTEQQTDRRGKRSDNLSMQVRNGPANQKPSLAKGKVATVKSKAQKRPVASRADDDPRFRASRKHAAKKQMSQLTAHIEGMCNAILAGRTPQPYRYNINEYNGTFTEAIGVLIDLHKACHEGDRGLGDPVGAVRDLPNRDLDTIIGLRDIFTSAQAPDQSRAKDQRSRQQIQNLLSGIPESDDDGMNQHNDSEGVEGAEASVRMSRLHSQTGRVQSALATTTTQGHSGTSHTATATNQTMPEQSDTRDKRTMTGAANDDAVHEAPNPPARTGEEPRDESTNNPPTAVDDINMEESLFIPLAESIPHESIEPYLQEGDAFFEEAEHDNSARGDTTAKFADPDQAVEAAQATLEDIRLEERENFYAFRQKEAALKRRRLATERMLKAVQRRNEAARMMRRAGRE